MRWRGLARPGLCCRPPIARLTRFQPGPTTSLQGPLKAPVSLIFFAFFPGFPPRLPFVVVASAWPRCRPPIARLTRFRPGLHIRREPAQAPVSLNSRVPGVSPEVTLVLVVRAFLRLPPGRHKGFPFTFSRFFCHPQDRCRYPPRRPLFHRLSTPKSTGGDQPTPGSRLRRASVPSGPAPPRSPAVPWRTP
jgi:hypothetical protein